MLLVCIGEVVGVDLWYEYVLVCCCFFILLLCVYVIRVVCVEVWYYTLAPTFTCAGIRHHAGPWFNSTSTARLSSSCVSHLDGNRSTMVTSNTLLNEASMLVYLILICFRLLTQM